MKCNFTYANNRWECSQPHCPNYIKAGPDADPQRMYAACKSPDGIPSLVDCVHRGDQIGDVECRLCGERGKEIEVFSCDKHESCTLKKYKSGKSKHAVCFLCPDRKGK